MSTDGHSRVDQKSLVNVLIICPHDEPRASLERFLGHPSEFRCVGSYADDNVAVREASFIAADVALMDIHTNAISDFGCVRRLRRLHPRLIPVWVTSFSDQDTLAQAVAAGVEGYLAKPLSIEQCLATLRFVVRRSGVPGRSSEQCIRAPADAIAEASVRFTGREKQVLEGLEKGLLYKEIADQLGISFSAVHKYQHNIFVKLQANNRTEAIARWRGIHSL
jgi:DNA-binding NarL/FixJ family response regulator